MKKFLAVAFLISMSAPAFAEGLYVGGTLGLAALDASDLEPVGGGAIQSFQMNLGFSGGVMVGSVIGENMRVEGELIYSTAGAEQIGSTTVSGSVGALQLGANLLYDFGGERVRPYVGGGLAVINIDVGDVNISGSPVFEGAVTTGAAQIILGVSIPLESVTLFADYRGLMTPSIDLTVAGGGSTWTMDSYFRNSLMFGFRAAF